MKLTIKPKKNKFSKLISAFCILAVIGIIALLITSFIVVVPYN